MSFRHATPNKFGKPGFGGGNNSNPGAYSGQQQQQNQQLQNFGGGGFDSVDHFGFGGAAASPENNNFDIFDVSRNQPGQQPQGAGGAVSIGTSEMFASYEEQFFECEAEIRKLLATAGKKLGAAGPIDARVKAVYECQRRITSAEQAIFQMEQELRTLPNAGAIQQRVKQYRTIVQGFRREHADANRITENDALLAQNSSSPDYDPRALQRLQQVRMEETSGRIGEGNAHLARAQQAAVETERTGMNIMGDLRGQREVLDQSRAHMNQINTNLTQSRRVILQMSRRVLANKIILMSTALVLSITLILLLFIKLGKHT